MTQTQIVPAVLTQDEEAYISAAYRVMNPAMERARLANFGMTIMHAESTEVFHRVVKASEELGVPRGELIAIQTLGACLDQISGFNGEKGDPKLKALLLETAKQDMGEKFAANLESYANGLSNSKNNAPYEGDNLWNKIGAMKGALEYLTMFSKFHGDFLKSEQDHARFKTVTDTMAVIVDSCGDLGSQLMTFYTERRAAITALLEAKSLTQPTHPAPTLRM